VRRFTAGCCFELSGWSCIETIPHELLHKIREILFEQGKDLGSNIMCGLLFKGETWFRIVLRNMYLQRDVKRHTVEVQAEVQQ